MASIIIERGPDKGRVVSLKNELLSFGRGSDCTIYFDDPVASRIHFTVEKRGDDFFITDMGSLNGTQVNGEAIAEVQLEYGDHIQAGSTLFSFVSGAEAEERSGLFGKDLGGYRIEKRLGRGGAGTVYLAQQLSMDRPVALKVLSKIRSANPTFVEQFMKEAQSAGKLNHAKVVQVYDVQKVDEHLFFSMEFMQGGSLGELLVHTDHLVPAGALSLMKDVASGLEYAEEMNIVHRDIKPENIMLDGRCGAKIGDLGIAISLEAASSNRRLAGTPQYMSPEQAQSQPVDHRSDIYSLGCTFYRLLTGQYPFSGSSQESILRKQVETMPKPMNVINPEISTDIDNLVRKMMAKRPSDRFQNATELLADIEEVLEQTLSSHKELPGQDNQSRRVLTRVLPRATGGIDLLAESGLTEKIHVLIVDDEPSVLTFVENIFSFFGCEVTACLNGAEALQKFRAGNFDLVITDRLMPKMNGDALSAAIKSMSPKTPIVMLTGLGTSMMEPGYVPTQIDLLLAKPLTLDQLKQTLTLVQSTPTND